VSSKSKPLDLPTFFVERSLGSRVVPDALRTAGVEVEIHNDHFAQDSIDEEWLSEVGRRGWVVLTKDRRIRYRPTELNALMKARVRAFVLTTGELQGREMALVFVKALPAIGRCLKRTPSPFIARVTRGGDVSVLLRG
jgi:predicted nuclease of predicted toxin-antitoxin system